MTRVLHYEIGTIGLNEFISRFYLVLTPPPPLKNLTPTHISPTQL
jgi:hypothetical protein